MRRIVCILLAALAAGCAPSQSAALETYTSPEHGFSIARPARWSVTATDGGRRVWFLPAPLPPGATPETDATEFLVVMTQDVPGPLPETEVRRLAMSLLPMHGVSGFQQMPATTTVQAWYGFELTGSTRGIEWASAGLLVTGARRLHYVVCAAPLPVWRERQKTCDEALRSFRPGDLTR